MRRADPTTQTRHCSCRPGPPGHRAPRWRDAGAYAPTLASKAGLLAETRLYLQTYRALGDVSETRRELLNRLLPQRSRATRDTILRIIHRGLVSWGPPPWVMSDLADFAADPASPALASALLLHVARQDRLLYEFVQDAVVPRWSDGQPLLLVADAQRFLDDRAADEPAVARWSFATRRRVASGVLSTLGQYGLLRGKPVRQIVEPIVPLPLVVHLQRLLLEEGIPAAQVAQHPDWALWLWTPSRAQSAVAALERSAAS